MSNLPMEKHIVTLADAPRILDWIQTRGGIAIWRSINLGNPGASWTTPVTDAEGKPTEKPSWQASSVPERIITDPAEVLVSEDVEVARLHIAIRTGSQGMSLKLTDGSSRRVRKAVAKAGEGAFYVFEGDEAVILKPKTVRPLTDIDFVMDIVQQ